MKIQPPSRQYNVMGIDKSTMRALEIKKTIRDDHFAGSLLYTIRRTVTQGGARLLDNWLSKSVLYRHPKYRSDIIQASPSTSLDVINSRLDLVTHMLDDEMLRERIIVLLRRSHDSHRLLQKFAFGRGDPDDLLELANTIFVTQELREALRYGSSPKNCVQILAGRLDLDGPGKLATRIKDAIDEEGVAQQHRIEDGEAGAMQELAKVMIASKGSKSDQEILSRGNRKKKPTSIRDHYSDEKETWIMKPAASPTLAQLHLDLNTLTAQKLTLAKVLCRRFGLASLTLRSTPALGYICHVKGKDININIAEVKSVSSSKSTRSFQHPEWTNLGEAIDHCRMNIRGEEQRLFGLIRRQVITHIIKLRQNAAVLDELDVVCSFAALAAQKDWTRPILNQSTKHNIVGGRHPAVEGGLEEDGRSFIRNDCSVGNTHQIWLVTGPNMAGKSTFLRQNALITLLAQVGSYVPAQYAELGTVDQIFSRVGSADDLYRDQSTFMVEMLETAMILQNATSRSFVIMDEIGRGTTPGDGTAVAFACLHHLYHVNKSRTLFATHFHALADIIEEEKMVRVGFYCTDVEESRSGDAFRYVHRLRQGVNRQSHALKVARLAGLPKDAITVALKLMMKRGENSV
jgi:DNA mismatch repair ATPase MutS